MILRGASVLRFGSASCAPCAQRLIPVTTSDLGESQPSGLAGCLTIEGRLARDMRVVGAPQ